MMKSGVILKAWPLSIRFTGVATLISVVFPAANEKLQEWEFVVMAGSRAISPIGRLAYHCKEKKKKKKKKMRVRTVGVGLGVVASDGRNGRGTGVRPKNDLRRSASRWRRSSFQPRSGQESQKSTCPRFVSDGAVGGVNVANVV
jgi:hypothetical protein